MAPAKTAGKSGAAPAKVRIADQNPLEFIIGGGLPTDFDGTIVKARTMIWNYDNGNGPKIDEKSGQVVLVPALRVEIARDGEDPVISYYSAGDKEQFWPMDENGNLLEQLENGCTEAEGVYFGLVGSREKMGSGTNHGHFMQGLLDAKFPADKIKPDFRFLDGHKGHWDRVAQKKRSGIVANREENPNAKPAEILLMTKYIGYSAVPTTQTAAPAKATSSAPAAAKATPQSPAQSAASANVEAKFRELVVTNLPDDGSFNKGGIAGKIMAKDSGFTPAERATAVKFVNNEYLEGWANEEGSAIIYDPETGEIYKNAAA